MVSSTMTALKKRARRIATLLRKTYPSTTTALHHDNPLQLLLATILSAQCTDAQVNTVTPALFARFVAVEDFASANVSEVEQLVHSTGFYKNKARNLIGCCQALMELHDGEVPQALEALIALPGVGRKTANVVRAAWWHIPGVVVDTHVKRISNLLGLTTKTDPVKIEYELMELLPSEEWNDFTMNVILHGRAICIARRPKCSECVLKKLCPSAKVGD